MRVGLLNYALVLWIRFMRCTKFSLINLHISEMTPKGECVFHLEAHIYTGAQYKHTYSQNAFLAILLNSLDFFLRCCEANILV